jgi:chromosome segregation ATPase
MANTDFIDEDLIQRRESVKEIKMGPAAAGGAPEVPAPAGKLNLTHLTRRKEDLNSQVATAMDELERLRQRQEALEREKSLVEFLRKSQEKYESGKRDLVGSLEQSLVSLEREEVLLNQRVELLADTEKRFKDMLGELRGIQEEGWPTDAEGYREELTRVLVLLDNMRKEFNKALARIEALRSDTPAVGESKPLLFEGQAAGLVDKGFWFWAKLGLAVSLPITVAILVLAAVIFALRFWFY